MTLAYMPLLHTLLYATCHAIIDTLHIITPFITLRHYAIIAP
jgi:hypothetical protein